MYYKYELEKKLWEKADLVIWIDYPLWLIEYRAIKRSIKRIFTKQTKPSGLPVNWKTEFGKDGLIRVLHKIHKATRTQYPGLLQKINTDTKIITITNKTDYNNLIKTLAA